MSHLFVTDLENEIDLVESYIQEYLRPAGLNQAVEDILSEVLTGSGKKIRPLLLLLAGRCGDHYQENRDRLCQLGALLEMVHLASLIHDDIVDDSPLRRGRPTIQSRFGKNMAVYAGDLVLSRVMNVLFNNHYMKEGRLFASIIEKMCSGEIGQHDCSFQPNTTVKDYYNNIYGKTAALFEGACMMGASAGGCGANLTAFFGELGKEFGFLFQMGDDLLDYVSGEQEEGKPVHMDFSEGIMTLPVLYAMENKKYRNTILALLQLAQNQQFTERDQKELAIAIEASGGMNKAIRVYKESYCQIDKMIRQIPGKKEQQIFQWIVEKLRLRAIMI
jgi:heptaprenyl diphosphate synthase